MTERQIISIAIENFQKTTQIQALWLGSGFNELDGKLRLNIENEIIDFNVETKNELRGHLLPKIYEFNQKYQYFILIAYRLYPEIKKQLQLHNIAYMEANGNFYFKDKNKWFWIDTNASLKPVQSNRNRAFTKTGLRVLFEFLNNPQLINQSYRQIAESTGTSIGNITHIINGLKEENLILPVNKNTFQIKDYKKALMKWADAYQYNLKPLLKIGAFRFLNENDFNNWREINFKKSITLWGGEPAGDMLTNYLNPGELTIYTEEGRSELMKNYKLIPDANGRVQVYQKFWKSHSDELIVPAVLVYADLINQNDRRCTETAEKIYEQYLQN